MAGYEITVNHNSHSVVLLSAKVEERLRWMIDLKLTSQFKTKNLKATETFLGDSLMLCALGKQELAYRGHDESEKSINSGKYVELLKYTAEYDPLRQSHYFLGWPNGSFPTHTSSVAVKELLLLQHTCLWGTASSRHAATEMKYRNRFNTEHDMRGYSFPKLYPTSTPLWSASWSTRRSRKYDISRSLKYCMGLI
jgi:hypothetical protein